MSDPTNVAQSCREAAARIAPFVRRTPLVKAPVYGNGRRGHVYLKLENRQRTGSFKFRGAVHRLSRMTSAEREAGCVTASSGNHGAAVAAAMRELGVHGRIYVPESVSDMKLSVIRAYGGDVVLFGTDGLDTELEARRVAEAEGMIYVSPYNDPHVIAGQGTIGVELLEQLPEFDRLVISVGGGGLLSGVASVVRDVLPNVEIVACQPQASAVMAASCQAGEIVEEESRPTLSDGTAGGIEPGAITFPLCQALIDRFVLVDERTIAREMQRFENLCSGRIEGAAAMALAAVADEKPEGRTVVIVCGGNVSDSAFEKARKIADDRSD